MEAFLDGMEQARVAGHDLAEDGVGRVVLRQPGRHRDRQAAGQDRAPRTRKALRGKAAIANARLAYEAYEEVFASPRWQALAEAGARPQRPLWASTGVKDPAYDDTQYVVELVARGVVNTMPEATLDAVADHGEIRGDTVARRVRRRPQGARRPRGGRHRLRRRGRVLEEEGVEKFETSWTELLESVAGELKRLAKEAGE